MPDSLGLLRPGGLDLSGNPSISVALKVVAPSDGSVVGSALTER